MGAMMNNIRTQWKEKNNQGVLSLFNCDFHEYRKRLIYLYDKSGFNIGDIRFSLIIRDLQFRADKGRILPKPERVLTIIKRLSSKGA